ncbi:WD repeat-containing protein-like protein [Cucurbitaria berberidis CBS 394.84]|uniref:WD repeat-containing protein-like protein n=1 Tax=Cucurbitaria berberidis CBS 394.84 TaxID=1168544 RepID=A0A9P4GL04_9PLEO|nr:WD repeat-containing protein-like protein [Cucurbitaria berberidis CBS 394.84]KAF1847167.1 WD repeat-containing protein-like protein [Cucurbitaria berberidis CBS 394.84]
MSSPCAPRTTAQEPTPDLFSSSPPAPAATTGSRKPKRPPPITPKRFTRFFTPRNSKNVSSHTSLSASGRQLQDITRAAINRNATQRSTPRKTVNFVDIENQMQTPQSSSRKRKNAYLSPETSPAQSSPSKRSRYVTPPPFEILDDLAAVEEPPVFPVPIRRLRTLGAASRTLQRSFGGILSVGRGFKSDHCTSWQGQTADFYSSSDDLNQLPQGAPPFTTASCNTNSLIAVGDEDGYIHLLDSDGDFSRAHVSWRAHSNAVMDLQFSSDDTYLAAGSGDQTAQIVDVRTQKTLAVLAKHKSSVKQVRFQPGDDKIVATSSRDGAVQIWDLRCKGGHMSVHSAWGSDAPYASVIRTLASAHADSTPTTSSGSSTSLNKTASSAKSESVSRRNDISVTALSFLPEGRQHLLLTASDASTCVKLWDIRGRYSLRGPAIPISTTSHPESHNRHRHFAINSLTLNGDASRLYALSKDNTVYAYSTSHLILGVAPELSTTSSSKQKYCQVGQEGLGPLYGFRHQNFHAGSFYVKASLRKASQDKPELLAVGSTDGCPVLFPTDERFLRRESRHQEDDADELPGLNVTTRSSSSRLSLSRSSTNSRCPDTIPIYEHGTPLIRGHDAEVTSVSWARNGSLISVSDDFRVRRWKEGSMARELRIGGESEGKRWQCGWADAREGYDDEE